MTYSPYAAQTIGRQFLWLGLVLGSLAVLTSKAQAQPVKSLRVGMAKSFFQDVPEPVARALLVPFSSLMLQHTGLHGEIVISDDAATLAAQLDAGKMDLGLFQGFEYAWVQQKFPGLKPLMITVNQKQYCTAQLVTRAGGAIKGFADLKGKPVSLPLQSGGHCGLFLTRGCQDCGGAPEKHCAKIVQHINAEAALDDVIRGNVAAAIVDGRMLECYATVKPGCMKLLNVVAKSELFPDAAVVYREGSLSEKTLDAFRSGMPKANKDPKSKGVMTLWKITAFDPVPANYQTVLENTRKAYPPPPALSAAGTEAAKAAKD